VSILRLTKYHGLGNDFLVVIAPVAGDLDGARHLEVVDAATAAALCDRHTGVGADGVITLHPLPGGRAVRMTLRNADGGLAETSGNGLRCAALAALEAGLVSGREVLIETVAGAVRADLVERSSSGGATLKVAMGQARVGELFPSVLGRFARMVDVGNPHLVLYPDAEHPARLPLRAVELAGLEHGVDGEVPGGLNVEAVTPFVPPEGASAPEALDLVVWERGSGETRACGSGSVAAAAALRAAGLVGELVEVRNPGGALLVELSGSLQAPHAALTGPAQLVARIEVDLEWLLDSRAPVLEGALVES
jgi:diaminopimelate epimerase